MTRRAQLTCLLALACALFAASPGTAARPRAARTSLCTAVLSQLNAVRAAHGLSRLRASAPLKAAAQSHSIEMLADGYFGHPSANGAAFWQRIEGFYSGGQVGENLLWASPEVSAQQAMQMWMASPEHRTNILDPHWREIGIGIAHSAAAPGWYHGRAVTVVTTDFGVRR